MKVLFICTGNTCRSPMAEGLVHMLNEEKHSNVIPLSVGLRANTNDVVSPQSVEAMKQKYDISNHQVRALKEEFVKAADLIITMTDSHKQLFKYLYPTFDGDIMTLAEFADETKDVEDPYGQSQAVYNECAQQIENYLRKGWHYFEK